MLEQPKPVPAEIPTNEKLLEAVRENTVWLKKLNEKFALLLILIIGSAIVSFLGALIF